MSENYPTFLRMNDFRPTSLLRVMLWIVVSLIFVLPFEITIIPSLPSSQTGAPISLAFYGKRHQDAGAMAIGKGCLFPIEAAVR